MQSMKITGKRRNLALFVAIIMSLSLWTALPMQSSAADPPVYTNGTLAFTLDGNNNATITGFATNYSGAATDQTLIIPSTITDSENENVAYPVTTIDTSAFAGKSALTSVTIQTGVTKIGLYAFSTCSSLESIIIPVGVVTIDTRAFASCSSLESITIPYGVETIGSFAFYNCTSLESLTLPASVTQIDQQAFQSCSVLKYVIIPSSAITISTNLFHDASQAYIYAEADSEMAKYLADSNKNASNNPSVIVPKGGTVEGTEDGNIIFTLPGVDNPVVVPPGAKVEAGEDGKIEVTLPGANSAIVVAPGSKVDMSGTVTDVWPPALTAGAVSRTGNTAATVKFTSSEAGEYYYAVVEKDEAAPTIDTATGTACDTAEQTINLSTLDAGAKDIYIVVKDAADNTSSATFKIAIPAYIPSAPRYTLTVENGTGGGSFIAGTSVSITANTPEDGKVFDTWTTSDGVTFADPSNSTTSFTMPAKAVTVTANYKDDPNGGGDDPNPPVEPPVADNGWVYENDVWKFFIDDVAQTGWVYDDAWYYLNADGIMQTGWVYDTDYKAWYYLAGNGAMKTGWVQTDGSWYYLAGNGAMVAAKWFHDTDGSWYYLSGNGKMLTGKQSIGGKTYAFKANGVWIS